MKPEIKVKWLEALRSGEYSQTVEALRTKQVGEDKWGYCCLGVLCDLYAKELPTEARWNDEAFCFQTEEEDWDEEDNGITIVIEQCETAMLPRTVRAWADIRTNNGRLDKEVETPSGARVWNLASANDSGLTFKQIANIIEEQL